jgi:parvulin-like peptidyl-prolyl isomerase
MRHPLLVALAVWFLWSSAAAAAEAIHKPLRDDDVVARVNGTTVYRKSVREVVQGILAMQDAEPDAATVDKLATDALESLIALELLYQESQARSITVSDADVDAEINRTKSRFPDARAFQSVLKARGMTEAALRQDTRKTMAVNRLLESTIAKDVTVQPAEIRRFYDEHQEEFTHPEQVRVSHILLRVPERAPAADRDAVRKRAESLLEQVRAQGDFAALARTRSEDASSSARGGDLGYISQGEMDPAFEKQAFALARGQLSGLISTPYGFEIIKVTDRRRPGKLPLEEVEERIRTLLEKRERQKRQDALVAELRKRAKVEVLDH